MTDAVFEQYRPQRLKIDGAQPHPGELVQSAAMAAMLPPKPTYTPNLPKAVIEMRNGIGLSDAQLEAVVYAGQTFQEIRPNGERRGFFIGDGTGVGKGREIAGILLDHIRQGKKKHVWISEKSGLINDAKRDMRGVGADPEMIIALPKDPAENAKAKAGVMFLTYATLRNGFIDPQTGAGNTNGKPAVDKKRSRFDQLKEWLGPDFDGVIAFDEAHNLRGAIETKGNRGKKKASLTGLVGIELQRAFPLARVVYVSATGATEVDNLAYAQRLGLWGEGTPFASVQDFISKIGSAGLSAMEIVAQSMKSAGMYISRSLSYLGIKYSRIEHQLTPLQQAMYDELGRAWQTVMKNIDAALDQTGQAKNGNAKAAARAQFWGSQLRFFNQVITAMQMPSVLEAIKADIAAGHSVVLQVVNTNEAAQERAVKKMQEEGQEEIEDLDLTPRQILIDYLQRSFPVQQYESYVDEDGNERSRPVVDSKGNAVLNADAVAARDGMIKNIEQIRMPDNPIDMVFSEIGHENVAEVTGRSRRFVRSVSKNGEIKMEEQTLGLKSRQADAAAFQDDKKRVLIFSDAGGTGFSFQADRNAKNQRLRRHYLLQPGWRADKAVQGFGRTHRTNQKQAPEYILVMTDVPGHKRFVSSIARRLDQLGALTKGQREAKGSDLFDATDNLESKYAKFAVSGLLDDMYYDRIPNGRRFLEDMGLGELMENANGGEKKWPPAKPPEVTQFINRVLILELPQQRVVFDRFMEQIAAQVSFAKQQGIYDEGLQTIRAMSARAVREKVVFSEPKTGAETKYLEVELTHPTKFYAFDTVNLANKVSHDFLGYYRNNQNNRIYGIARSGTKTDADGNVVETARMVGPASHRHQTMPVFDRRVRDSKGDVVTAWTKIEDEAAVRAAWQEETERTPKTYTSTEHFVYGAIMPIWDRLPSTVSVARMKLDDGRRILGRRIREDDLDATLQNLGVGSKASEMSSADLWKELQAGRNLVLSNGWVIKPVRAGHETRYEITGSYIARSESQLLVSQGAFIETHQWKERIYIPTDDPGVFQRIIASKPVSRIVGEPGREETSFARGDRPTRTLPVKDIEAAIAPIRRIGKGLPPTMVVQSQRQLPDGLQKAIEDSGSFVKAAYHEGSIYIIADHVESTDEAAYLMLHEAAHFGLEGIFGRELAAVMMKIWTDNQKIREKAAAFRSEHGVSQAKAVEEVLAEMAADGERATVLQRFVAWVRDWFRRRGVQVKMNDTDILAILSRAQGHWKRSPKWTHLYTNHFADGGPRGWGEVEGGPIGAQNAIPTEVIADDTAATVFESIRAGFIKRGLGELPAGALVRVAPQLDRLSDADALRGRDIRGAERIAQVFGHEVVWFENNAPEVRDFGGVVSSLDPKRIYINVRGYKPHLNVVGHELLHRMRAERPELYDRFLKAVTPLLQNTDNHQHPFAVGDDKQLEELLADFSGWNFMRRGFWREMAARDRSAFGKIADYILSFLDDLVLKMSRFVGDRSVYFSDVKAAQAALAEVMAEFKAGKAPMTTETLQFMAEATGRPPGTTEAQFTDNAPPSEGRFTSSYGNQARRAIDWIDAKLDPIGLLPGKAEYLAKRYATLGRIARLEEVSKELHKVFGQAPDEDQQAAYRFFLSPNGDPNMIPGSAARAAAVRAKSLIESVGDALVSREMMSPETREAHRGRYLPQVYLKFLLGDQNWKMLGAGKKVSDRGYLKNRKLDRIIGDDGEVHVVDAVTRQPVDEEFLNAVLGPVKDPGFLASMAIVKPSRDMAILDFLEQISEHEDWVLPHSTIEWRGRRVSVHWAKKEAERLRRQARHMDDPEASTARTYAEELDTLADEGLGKVTQHPDYRQIPDTSRYGRLRGIYVRKEIYDDLMGVNDFLPQDPGWFQSLFGYGGIGSKVTALWKAGKVSLNPPAQIRNAVSNFVLLQLSGVSLLKAPGRVMQAWKEIANGGVHWEIAKKFGVTESTWSSQELFRMRRDLLEIEQRAGHLKAWGKVKLLSAAMMDFAGDKYQFMEALFKTAKIIDEKARGKSDADAAIEAQRWLFDYSLVPKSVRYARSAPIGMPFLTFAYKVLPRLIEVATLHPQRLLPWVALAYALPMLVAQAWDVDDDDIEQLKMAMPEWLRDRGHAYILPYKDEHDRWQVLDLGYFFPWTTWTEPLRNAAEGEVGKAAQGLGLFSGPITDLIVANATGKDSFTGRDIVQKGDPPQRQFLSIMNYLWSMAAPPIVTDYGAAGHALRAATGTTNRYGDPLSSAGQAALRAIGINVYALNPEQERAKAVKRMVHEVEDTMLRLKNRLSDRGLSQADRDDIVAEYVEEMKRRQQKIRDYLEESEIHPNLATGAQ